MTDDPTPEWHTRVTQHLLWAVHVATQNEPDRATRNHIVQDLLYGVLARWDDR